MIMMLWLRNNNYDNGVVTKETTTKEMTFDLDTTVAIILI